MAGAKTNNVVDRASRCLNVYQVLADPLGLFTGATWPADDLDDINVNEDGYEAGFPPIGMMVERLERETRSRRWQSAGVFVFDGEMLVKCNE